MKLLVYSFSAVFGLALAGLVACEPQSRSQDSQQSSAALSAPEPSDDQKVAEMEKARAAQREADKSLFNIGNTLGCKFISGIRNEPPARTVTLTFDDGPDANLTPQVLDILARHNIKATFFVEGVHAAGLTNIIKRARAEGHLIGNHSWNHANFHDLSADDQRAQVTATEVKIKGYSGPQMLFRYPYGNSTCEGNDFIHGRGYQIVGWHIDTCDWAYAKTGSVTAKQAANCDVKPENIDDYVGHTLEQIDRRNGGIILMHDVHANTVGHLEEIIDRLEQRGYRFVNLDSPQMRAFFR